MQDWRNGPHEKVARTKVPSGSLVKPALAWLLGAVLLSGCAGSGTIVDRPGATAAQVRAEHDNCHEAVKRQPELYVLPQGTLAGAAGAGAIAGVSGVLAEERAVDVCMAQRGYVERTLTEEEKRRIAAAPRGAARDAAVDAVMLENDAAPAASDRADE